MTRTLRFLQIYVVFLISCFISSACAGTAGSDSLPNVILILTDDVGYGDCRVYNPESRIPLPNLERLAARGMVFTDAHSPAALCAPTRYSVLTGNYPWRGRNLGGTWGYNQQSQILPGQETLGNLMKKAGYRTAMYGKYHMGGHFWSKENPDEYALDESDYTKIDFYRRFDMGPTDLGFDYSFMLLSGIQNHPYAYFENDLLVGDPEEMITVPNKNKKPGPRMPYWKTDTVGPVMTGKVMEFIDHHYASNAGSGSDNPFFIYYCSQCIHTPIKPADEIMGVPVKGETFHKVGDFLYEMDVTLGVIMQDLERRRQLENTLIIFTSDNGAWPHLSLYENKHDPNAPLAGWKGTIWEGGHRVPFIAAWGDSTAGSFVPPGTRNPQIIGGHDIYATLAELTGQKMDADQGLDSHSFLDGLLTNRASDPRRWLLVQGKYMDYNTIDVVIGGESKQGNIPARMLRDGPWKLIVQWRKVPGDSPQNPAKINAPIGLYNLEEDPKETNNLICDRSLQDRIRSMMEKYNEIDQSERSTAIQ